MYFFVPLFRLNITYRVTYYHLSLQLYDALLVRAFRRPQFAHKHLGCSVSYRIKRKLIGGKQRIEGG